MADSISMDDVVKALGSLHVQLIFLQKENDRLKEEIKRLTEKEG